MGSWSKATAGTGLTIRSSRARFAASALPGYDLTIANAAQRPGLAQALGAIPIIVESAGGKMSELIESTPESHGTSVSRFLANRGAIVVKETRPVGRFKGEHGDAVSAETVILNIVKGTKKETSYGVRLERLDADGDFDSAVFLDYDELDELIGAIDFISKTANELQNQARDYTEVTYSTKDSAKVGFYHSKDGQLAFLMLSDHRGNTFLPVHRLAVLKQIFHDAKTHLTASGATSD